MTNILHNIFHCLTLNRKEAIGIRIILLQLFGISITCFTGKKGEDIKSGLHLFNIELGFQLLPALLVKRLFPKKEYIHYCDSCGPFVKGYSEVWEEGANGPFKIELFHYKKGSKVMVEEIVLNDHKKNKPVLVFNYCGVCNGLIENKFLTKEDANMIMKRQRTHQF